ncbi:MAG: primary-amine oxidase, partial [Solirubrobacteraceae bacterium]|nr:primary-amine oxidase [Solirubrobacteraceae bacterium]
RLASVSKMHPHPLDPLTADEIREAVSVLRAEHELDAGWRFASIELVEPPKQVVYAFDAAATPTAPVRRAQLNCWSATTRDSTHTAVVRLATEGSGAAVESWVAHPGKHANATLDEFHAVDDTLRTDPSVLAELASRGITDLDLVVFDVWAFAGFLVPEAHRHRRIGWTDVWVRSSAGGNPYAGPVPGLSLLVDLDTAELLEIERHGDVQPAAPMGEYAPALVPGQTLRDDRKPLEIVQPDGTSFTLEGNLLRWQKWSLRLGFNHREGLVLHTVGYEDEGRVRPIAHRMSFAEMVVPYRDPTPTHARRTAFDVGEWGLGFMTTSLELGCDCLGEITYVDAVLHDAFGQPKEIPQAICLHEEDAGVLWKHVDERAGAEVRRMRRMVISFHVTVANYEYLTYWRLYEDGNIECEVRATGIMVTTPFNAGEAPPYGTVVDDRTYAPIHQHFIVARLDLDVDGPANTVHMTETQMVPVGPSNPHGLGLVQVSTPLRTELEGIQDFEWSTQRAWKVVNPGSLNAHGTPVAYKLVPGAAFPAMFPKDSPILQRSGVIDHTLWVTPQRDDERWPCGEFVVQSTQDDGLPAWTAADRPIENTDVVLWYVFGIHHVPRVEDWPVMPSDTVSFWLKPTGFFDRNPSLDVAPSPGHGEGSHCH